ncbi:MAG: hypothetical protein ACR2NP_00565 [Pirellulaceae bacterium]
MILLVGATTFVAGIVLILRHLHVWRKMTDASDDMVQKKYLWSQLRRRTLTSTCITVLGFILMLLHFMEFWRDRPIGFTILVSCMLVLVVMIFVLASFDFLAVSQVARTHQNQNSEAAQELAREYHRLKNKASEQPGTNPSPDNPSE